MRKKLLFAVVVFLCLIKADTGDSTFVAQDTSLQKAPTFFAKTLAGDDFFLSKEVGAKADPEERKAIVLSFFTTSCIPCRQEIPIMMELSKEYQNIGFYLVNIAEDEEKVGKFVKEMDYTLPVLLDRYGYISTKKYDVSVSPAVVMITPDGLLFHKETGLPDEPRNHYEQLLDALTEK
ncbi:MAG TPA: TlpA disulfide reductase family protein [bacterium]|nr:TlpA disulfide reductase family protein [bacterium]